MAKITGRQANDKQARTDNFSRAAVRCVPAEIQHHNMVEISDTMKKSFIKTHTSMILQKLTFAQGLNIKDCAVHSYCDVKKSGRIN